MKREEHRWTRTWTQIFRVAFARVRRTARASWEAQGQEVATQWRAHGSAPLQSDFRLDGADVYSQAKVNGQKLRRWLDDDDVETGLAVLNLAPALLAALPREERLVVLGELLEPFGLLVQPRPAGGDMTVVQAFMEEQRECADVTRAAIEALADGKVDHEERLRLVREIEEAKQALDDLAEAATRHAEG